MTPERFIAGLPKAELHMHIEGSMEPGLFLELARRNRVALRWQSEEELRAAYRFTDLQDFLDLYYDGCRVLIEERDFFDVTMAYLRRAHADEVLHAEMFLGPQGHSSRGVPLATVMQGVFGAMAAAEQELGISSRLIAVAQRHRSEAEALALLEELQPWHGQLAGVGLGGAERGNPPAKFSQFFARARALGLHLVAHAGEEGPAGYVRESVELLGVDRVDHGNACVDDPALMAELARRRIPLTMCPISNLRLQVVPSLDVHPLKRLLDAGLCVTVNSDDPSYFGGYVNENYLACQQALGLSREELAQLARNSFEAAFIGEPRRDGALARIDAWLAAAKATESETV